ncbi:NUDIX domain-containing protein [Streptomyces fructofermentans]|uniref:Nudix hydrolase domain-containing protein n=1 Tax=Streptomyces fructofermentans TaxID=152141 RepID=A0A918NTD5_9ACTN|nr:NUDIX domain-containing protein [Streptomyces fructofermentans]GGX93907.1 hypothetical protein GCM10010515_70930 [Streptomyces fructofermentans]
MRRSSDPDTLPAPSPPALCDHRTRRALAHPHRRHPLAPPRCPDRPALRSSQRTRSPRSRPCDLLLRYDENGGFWATPGGSLEDGEDHSTATLRELSEELGIDEKAVELGAQLAERSKDHLVGGREVRQVEKYFLTRVCAADVDPARASRPDNRNARRCSAGPPQPAVGCGCALQ